jgi:alkylation response protein AidB-like acyl-CoA dehydrogenase
MDFRLPKDVEALQKEAREFAEQRLAPMVPRMEAEDLLPRELLTEMAKVGLLGLCVARDYGGLGVGQIGRVVVLEEIARVSAACAFSLAISQLAIHQVEAFGTAGQKEALLRSLALGEKLITTAVTEAESGSNPALIQTRAQPEAAGWRLTGRKVFITNVTLADMAVVSARTGRGPKGLSTFLVDLSHEGVIAGPRLPMVGIRGCEIGELHLQDVLVPREALLGKEGEGFVVTLSAITQMGRTGMAAIGLGIARAALEHASSYAKRRRLGEKLIKDFQAVQWLLADCYEAYESARLLTLRAAWLIDEGQKAESEVALAKFAATEAAVQASRRCLDVFGGYGYLARATPERLWRDAICTIATSGTSEIMRILMAKGALKKAKPPKDPKP